MRTEKKPFACCWISPRAEITPMLFGRDSQRISNWRWMLLESKTWRKMMCTLSLFLESPSVRCSPFHALLLRIKLCTAIVSSLTVYYGSESWLDNFMHLFAAATISILLKARRRASERTLRSAFGFSIELCKWTQGVWSGVSYKS